VKISGHTSSVGGYTHNVVLSERRAAAVKRFLTNNGIDTDRIEIEGCGPDYPIASNATEKGQKENRRVDFSITHQ
jgi:outer membrane protein OmpA-like peptidoglycan-associated protein